MRKPCEKCAAYVRKFLQPVAQKKLSDAYRNGTIVRPKKCGDCHKNSSKIHGHHWDYTKPLDVLFLCPKCHKAKHKDSLLAYIDPIDIFCRKQHDNIEYVTLTKKTSSRVLINDAVFNEITAIATKFGYKKKGKDSIQVFMLKGAKFAESHPEFHDYFRK